LFLVPGTVALADGMFGPPQTLSRKSGGLNTAVAYRYAEDTFQHDTAYVLRQQQVYSQAAYGAGDIWEVYGRIGISDLRISGAFVSTDTATSTTKTDFAENWKFFGTLGAKAFLPLGKIFGIGAFVQGTYHLSNYTDNVTGVHNGVPFETDLKIKNLWDVHGGIGLQATVPWNIKLYGGPYVYYSEADAVLTPTIPGILFGAEKVSVHNKSIAGGFFGIDVPLAKGFRLNIEGQFADRFSIGSAITYVY